MTEYTKDLAALAGKLAPLAETFKDGFCNDACVQSIIFTVPEILRFHQALEETIIDSILPPNKHFDASDFAPLTSGWYTYVAEMIDVEKLILSDIYALWDKVSIQLMHHNAGVPFRVWDSVRYNDNTYNWLKEHQSGRKE